MKRLVRRFTGDKSQPGSGVEVSDHKSCGEVTTVDPSEEEYRSALQTLLRLMSRLDGMSSDGKGNEVKLDRNGFGNFLERGHYMKAHADFSSMLAFSVPTESTLIKWEREKNSKISKAAATVRRWIYPTKSPEPADLTEATQRMAEEEEEEDRARQAALEAAALESEASTPTHPDRRSRYSSSAEALQEYEALAGQVDCLCRRNQLDDELLTKALVFKDRLLSRRRSISLEDAFTELADLVTQFTKPEGVGDEPRTVASSSRGGW